MSYIVGTSRITILVLLLSISVISQLPRCPNQEIIFIEQPTDVLMDCRISDQEVATFPCHFRGNTIASPQWIINSTVYSSLGTHLPIDHYYSNYTLFVRSEIQKNNTVYQCQIPIILSNGSLCAYTSTIGRLIVKCTKALHVNCTPHYLFLQRSRLDILTGISTTITLPHEFQIDNDSFSITYTDSLCGRSCGSDIISSSSCVNGTCYHEFNFYSSSLSCINATAINVTVASTTHPDLYKSESVTIAAFNTFVDVLFESSTLNLTFINQAKEGEKYYSLMYSPIVQDCEQLPSKTDAGRLSNTNSLSLQLNDVESTAIGFNLEVSNGTNSVSMKGIYYIDVAAVMDVSPNELILSSTLPTAIVLICILIIAANIVAIIGMSRYFNSRKQAVVGETGHFNQEGTEENDGELDDTYVHRSAEIKKDQSQINLSTTYYKLFHVTNECFMHEFGMKHFPGYLPENGYGYVKVHHDDLKSIPPHNKVILMNCEDLKPEYIAFSSAIKQTKCDIYEQNTSYSKELTPDSSFLYCALSREVTAFWSVYDVTEKCSESNFANKNIPRYTPDWSHYCYFEFTKAECIKPYQSIFVLTKNDRLVTGPGVRHLVGAMGDGSSMTHPSQFKEEWDSVFIQSRATDSQRELIPGTKYLFCAMMEKVRGHYSIYNILKQCNMAEFGRRNIPGYRPEQGYGYYEFTQDEFYKPHKKVILVHKNNKLFTGGGAQFVCAGDEYNMDAILQKHKISPPDLSKTEWKHVFIQSHSEERELLPGTKFLYCESKTHKTVL